MTYTVTHIGRSTKQTGPEPDWTPKERAMDEMKAPERLKEWADWHVSCNGGNISPEAQDAYGTLDALRSACAERDAARRDAAVLTRNFNEVFDACRAEQAHSAKVEAERDALATRVKALEADNARHKMLLEAVKAWAEGKPSWPPNTGREKSSLTGEAS